MKRFMCFVALIMFVVVVPLAGCGGPEVAGEGEEGMVDPGAMMDAAAIPDSPYGGTAPDGSAAPGGGAAANDASP